MATLKTLPNGTSIKKKLDDPLLVKAFEAYKKTEGIQAVVAAYNEDPINSVFVSQISDVLRSNALQNLDKALITDETYYAALLQKARDNVKGKIEDSLLMAKAVKAALPVYVNDITALYVKAILVKNGKSFEDDDIEATVAKLSDEKYQVGGFGSETKILEIYDTLRVRGKLPEFVDVYINKKEIDTGAFSPLIKEHMIRYLMDLNFSLAGVTEAKIKNGHYDEYFALAYNHALKTVKGGDDPIDAFRSKSDTKEWDFTVDEFESIEEQGVIPERILAAGALDYIYELGDNLGIFKLTDFLVLNWVSGNIDIGEGEVVNKLYRHLKLKDERSSEEERAMLYKRVLNKGEGNVLDNMVVNDRSTDLWTKLMEETVKYIEKTEARSGDLEVVSKQPIYQAIKEIQYNLTSSVTGMAPIMTREIYAHLKDCFDILNDKDIISQLATGSRKSMWVVIENLAKQELKLSLNVSASRTVAVKGNQIYRFIAEFNGMAVAEDRFQEFKEAVEAYIIAQSQLGNMEERESDEDDVEEDEDLDKEIEKDENDDFDA